MPENRASFLDKMCDGDKSSHREVFGSIYFSENTDSFIEKAAFGKVADMFDSKNKNLQIGGCLNHYRAL